MEILTIADPYFSSNETGNITTAIGIFGDISIISKDIRCFRNNTESRLTAKMLVPDGQHSHLIDENIDFQTIVLGLFLKFSGNKITKSSFCVRS